jgi:hypothetical protein
MILLAALPDLLTAAGFLLIWMRPDLTGAGWVSTGVATLLMEFLVVHSSGFYAFIYYGDGPRRKRVMMLMGLAAVYLLLLCGFAAGLHAWWMVGAFFWLSFSKALGMWTSKASPDASLSLGIAIGAWALSVAVYLFTVVLSASLYVPRLGVTPEIQAATGLKADGGVWEAQPWAALAGGALYFTLVGLLRTLLRLIVRRRAGAGQVAAV